MKHLSKFFLATLLLTVASVSWAACPEGYKSNYKGECVDASGNVPKYLRNFFAASVLFDKEDDGYGTFCEFEYHGRNAHKKYGVNVVNRSDDHPVRHGKQSIRFEVRPGDCGGTPGDSDCETPSERSELNAINKDKVEKDYWYAWSVFFKKGYVIPERVGVHHGQWKQFLTGKPSLDVLTFTIYPNKGLTLEVDKDFDGNTAYPYLLIPKKDLSNQWHDFVVNIKWSPDKDGRIRVWRNGKLLVNHKGPNAKTRDPLSFRFGTYRTMVDRENKPLPTQIVYYDEVMRGKTCEAVNQFSSCEELLNQPLTTADSSPPAKAKESPSTELTTSGDIWVQISQVKRDGTPSDGMVWREIDVTLQNHPLVFFEPHVWFFGGGTEDKPNHVGLQFNHKTLPSIDIPKMKRCGGYKWFAKETSMGNKRVMFPFREKRNVASCLYNALDKNDQAIVKAVIDQIEEIIDQGTEGQPDADYWKKIAKIIKDNGSNVIQ